MPANKNENQYHLNTGNGNRKVFMYKSKSREISIKNIMQGEKQTIILHADKRYSLRSL